MKRSIIMLIMISISMAISGVIDLKDLFNYSNQTIPNYIIKDNTPPNNMITDAGATLGRVLFYDKNLSLDNSTACASCHHQEFAFSDTARASVGINGTTGRHSMRLVNSRFADERRFFWDERANTLEDQTTMPIQDHIEMGFSGTEGDPGIDSLINKLTALEYYRTLFEFVYGDPEITETRMQLAISQFVRSIQSFDSKFDEGFAQSNNLNQRFFNATMQEQMGKMMFIMPPTFDENGNRIAGGGGCAGCHAPPEFAIDPRSLNNGFIDKFDGTTDLTNTRSPSLRDLFNADGEANGPFMHNGVSMDIYDVIDHYNDITEFNNANLDDRLKPAGNPQKLNFTQDQKDALVAFLKTLSGNDLYSDPKWSDPFTDGEIQIQGVETSIWGELEELLVYPNPAIDQIRLSVPDYSGRTEMIIVNGEGRIMYKGNFIEKLDISNYPPGAYFIRYENSQMRFVKE